MARTKKNEAGHADAAGEQHDAEHAVAQGIDAGLVRVTKGGDVLDVHPSCVAAHKSVGWAEA